METKEEMKEKKVTDLMGGELYEIVFEAIRDAFKIIKVNVK